MKIKGVAASLAAFALTVSFPAAAGGYSQAEKIRRLDIMLMVTGLRCRTTADNFQPEYGRFTTNHIGTLNAAAQTLKAEFVARHGAVGANRALDRLSVQMANQYGQGHPWLNCRELKQVTRTLADMRGTAPLYEAADDLLNDGSRQMAWLR
ncbi:S-adenosyl-L-homocysteine hydrolase [Novosphingobium sp.]|uniref:S-adenosyl-L-homocysteine hydrolase n=1 Tax=Novosphingobium sp. TaxID=1874826 RepID=UPI0025DDCD05|nr:S-adenosyl-L-homocysteine hydrolase [Novosphingobium sp.]MCC6924368.1 S-adenosyl-L-homocysteine hydrolase [Novosphingobium sp.]